MLRRAFSLCAVLGMASVANAGAVVSLTANPDGPYLGGEIITVDVTVTSDTAIQPRLLGFDFSASDPALTLLGPDNNSDGTDEFVFDFSSLLGGFLYASFPNFPLPQVVYTSTTPNAGFILSLSAGVPFHAGSLQVQLPMTPDTYVLDAMNFAAADNNTGARIDFDFANTQIWSTVADGNVELEGGQLALTVIPEPATLALLSIGGLAAAFRRRRNA